MIPVADAPKRSLYDDPAFQASLAELDQGLRSPSRAPASAAAPVSPPAAPAAPTDALDLHIPEAPELHIPDVPIVTSGEARPRRALLDLFPMAPEADGRAEGERANRLPPRGAPPASGADPTYETFYGLYERPFSVESHDLKFLYHSTEYDRVAQALLGAIWRRDGVAVLTGEAGVGKTMLCEAVLDQLDRRTFTSFVTEPCGSFDDLLKTMLVDVGVVSRDDAAAGRLRQAARADLMGAMREFLASLGPLQGFAVLIVDRAQDLAIDVLEEIGLLLDAAGEAQVLQVILVGQPGLTATLSRPELKPLAGRITLRCRLGPLEDEEIAGYVSHRIHAAGASPRLEFDARAIRRLYDYSRGIPRLVNLLCERALSAGFGISASVIDDRLIESAAEDLDVALPLAPTSVLRVASFALVLFLLAVTGGAAATYVLRAEVATIMAAWQDVPRPPASPVRPVPALPDVAPPEP
jgi:general secretion pathway protein A